MNTFRKISFPLLCEVIFKPGPSTKLVCDWDAFNLLGVLEGWHLGERPHHVINHNTSRIHKDEGVSEEA